MEPLAAWLRQHHTESGLTFTSRGIIISQYAEDITLFIKHPQTNLQPALRELTHFGGLSGVQINWKKSTLFPFPGTAPFELDYPLCWAQGPVKYLGIWLSRNIQELWNMNVGCTVTWLEGKTKFWSTLPLSLAGRIAVAKMVVLPKFLYIFANVPLIYIQEFFHKLRPLMIPLVWVGGQARVSWEILTLPQSQGGLDAPDLPLYAFCAQTQFLHFWIHLIPFQLHVAVECDIVAPVPLEVALYLSYKRPRHTIDTTETLRWAWDNLRRRAHVPTLYAPSITLARNPQMPPLEDQGAVTHARRLGITSFADLYHEEAFLEPLSPTDTLPPSFSDILLYHRIRATCRKMHTTFPDPPPTLQAFSLILQEKSL